ncbi:MAG: SIS domain-containing protein [Chloroflexota bacterium]|nr:SIS domain-containing protein [Chloroflexota bacterium]
MDAPKFDPTAPLPAPPDPWAGSDMPSARSGPPYHMTDMIAAEPHLAGRLLGRLLSRGSPAGELAGAVRDAASVGHPIVVTGCGTSEHGAQGVADILREALRAGGVSVEPNAVMSAQAFEAALDPQRSGLLIGVSHEGGSAATNAVMQAARSAGARVALITAGPASPGAALAGIVVTTDEMDQSWCHTIGYLAPLLAAAATGSIISGRRLEPGTISQLMAMGSRDEAGAEASAGILAGASHIIVIASGADRPAARELVLKIEEAAWLPSAMRDLETFLHGHLPATGESTGLVLILADRDHRAERLARARQALAAARVVGIKVAAILAADAATALDQGLTPAGRLIVPETPSLPAPVAALLGTATPLQLLTERIARAAGTNPDAIRRDDPRYLEAAAAGE